MKTNIKLLIPIFIFFTIITSYILKHTFPSDSLSSWVSAVATLAIAILTYVLACETWYLRKINMTQLEELKRENIRPDISFQFRHNPININIIDFQIKNFGKGIAKNISFSFFDSNDEEIKAGQNIIRDKLLALPIFSKGIKYLGINQDISSFLFNFISLKKELNNDIFNINFYIIINFEDIQGYKYENIFEIDFTQYKGISEMGDSKEFNSYKIAQSLEKISNAFSTHNKINVNIFDSKDREESRKRIEEYLE